MKTKILWLAIAVLLNSCATFHQKTNYTYLVWRYDKPIENAKTPSGFVVTPQEIYKIILMTKYGHNIYADQNNYYISSANQKFSKTGDNASLAKKMVYAFLAKTEKSLKNG